MVMAVPRGAGWNCFACRPGIELRPRQIDGHPTGGRADDGLRVARATAMTTDDREVGMSASPPPSCRSRANALFPCSSSAGRRARLRWNGLKSLSRCFVAMLRRPRGKPWIRLWRLLTVWMFTVPRIRSAAIGIRTCSREKRCFFALPPHRRGVRSSFRTPHPLAAFRNEGPRPPRRSRQATLAPA